MNVNLNEAARASEERAYESGHRAEYVCFIQIISRLSLSSSLSVCSLLSVLSQSSMFSSVFSQSYVLSSMFSSMFLLCSLSMYCRVHVFNYFFKGTSSILMKQWTPISGAVRASELRWMLSATRSRRRHMLPRKKFTNRTPFISASCKNLCIKCILVNALATLPLKKKKKKGGKW